MPHALVLFLYQPLNFLKIVFLLLSVCTIHRQLKSAINVSHGIPYPIFNTLKNKSLYFNILPGIFFPMALQNGRFVNYVTIFFIPPGLLFISKAVYMLREHDLAWLPFGY
jgi:hypothetical protein